MEFVYVVVEVQDGDVEIATFAKLSSALRKAGRWIESYTARNGFPPMNETQTWKYVTDRIAPSGKRRQMTLYEDEQYSVTIRACTVHQ